MVSTPRSEISVLCGGEKGRLKREVEKVYRVFRRNGRKKSYPLSFSHLGPQCLLSLKEELESGLPSPEAGQALRHVGPPDGRSGCSPAEPYPPEGGLKVKKKSQWRPEADHPWRKSFKRR